tara:strand:+ start:514 stop:666 length:153 start_codon:yes stop_codon:yes gene_type:complete
VSLRYRGALLAKKKRAGWAPQAIRALVALRADFYLAAASLCRLLSSCERV